MEKFVLGFKRTAFTLITLNALVGCSPADVVDDSNSQIDSYTLVSGTIEKTDTGKTTVASGTGTLLFTSSLPGVASRASFRIRGALNLGGSSSITLVTYANPPISKTSDVGIQILGDNSVGIKIRTWVHGQAPVELSSQELSAILYNDFDLVLDVHNNTDMTYNLLLWPSNYAAFSPQSSLISPGASLPLGNGFGVRYGLIMENASISILKMENAKVQY